MSVAGTASGTADVESSRSAAAVRGRIARCTPCTDHRPCDSYSVPTCITGVRAMRRFMMNWYGTCGHLGTPQRHNFDRHAFVPLCEVGERVPALSVALSAHVILQLEVVWEDENGLLQLRGASSRSTSRASARPWLQHSLRFFG